MRKRKSQLSTIIRRSKFQNLMYFGFNYISEDLGYNITITYATFSEKRQQIRTNPFLLIHTMNKNQIKIHQNKPQQRRKVSQTLLILGFSTLRSGILSSSSNTSLLYSMKVKIERAKMRITYKDIERKEEFLFLDDER